MEKRVQMCITRTLFTIIAIITCIDRHELDLIKGPQTAGIHCRRTFISYILVTHWAQKQLLSGPSQEGSRMGSLCPDLEKLTIFSTHEIIL